MTTENGTVKAVIARHGDLYVIDPIEAKGGDTIIWRAPSDLVVLFPDEPDAGVFVDSSGRPVERLKIRAGTEACVQVARKYPEATFSDCRANATHGLSHSESSQHGRSEEFPYAIYLSNWEDPHSAFLVGGSHPRLFIMWPD